MRMRFVGAVVLLGVGAAFAQKVYTAADYARAERWMDYNERRLVEHQLGGFEYLPDGRVFYHEINAKQTLYWVADPKTRTKVAAFSAERVAAALRRSTGLDYRANQLMAKEYKPDAAPAGLGGFTVTAREERFHCKADASQCTHVMDAEPHPAVNAQAQSDAVSAATGHAQGNAHTTQAATMKTAARGRPMMDVSPDGTKGVFIRDWNLWVRDLRTGEERALTTDGVTDYGYATDNAGWTHSDAPIVLWSADSKKLATFQQDQRRDGMMYLVSTTNRHPELEAWRYPLLGDKDVTMIERVIIDVASGKMTRLRMAADEHRSTLCDDVSCKGGSGWDDVQFSSDAKTLAFVSTSRDHKDEWLRVADTATGDVRTVFHDHVATYYESGQGKVNWKYLPATNEFLWYSERSDWGQMYLYDLTTGTMKNAVTYGAGCVTEVLHVDEAARKVYFLATGEEEQELGVRDEGLEGRGAGPRAQGPGGADSSAALRNGKEDPYLARYYVANLDGTGQRVLTPEDANHEIVSSADGATFVDTYSTAQQPPMTVLRARDGSVLMSLGAMSIDALTAAGWRAPQSIRVKARDGKSDLYGYLWLPTWFDAHSAAKLPIADHVYPGPQQGSCPTRSFHVAADDNQAVADLGFAVVCIDGMGTPLRSKSFHDAHASSPAEMGEDTIPDQVAGLKDLARQMTFLDISRAGIWGHSGGGNATVSAMFHYPEFFSVGWAESGNHDNRDYEDDWDEKYAGLEVIKDGHDNYEQQANQNYAANLRGKLMLVHGTMDDNVPPSNTLLVADALMKANRTFDMLMVPNAQHGYAEMRPYIMRRRWDYLVTNLARSPAPQNYTPKTYDEVLQDSLY